MTLTNNVGIAERAVRSVWTGGRGTAQKALFADDFMFRNLSSLDDVTDLDGLRQRTASVRSLHRCARLQVQDTVASGDLVSVWWTFKSEDGCRSQRALRAVQREVMDGTCMLRLRGGQIAEMWELGGQLVELAS
jgi:hypothetical protein